MNLTRSIHSESVLFLTLDSCRFDSFKRAKVPNLRQIGALHCALSPSYFTYGSHSAFWMGFTPGVIGSKRRWLNPKAGKLFRMVYSGSSGNDGNCFNLDGRNLVEGFRNLGYLTVGTGAVEWFNTKTPTGSVLSEFFDHFWYSGNTWSLLDQLQWIDGHILQQSDNEPIFLFLNIGETHVPYWHKGANWEPWPSPCVPFGGNDCSKRESRRRQVACLEWVDNKLQPLLEIFKGATILACSDHGDCWGENGLWEHGISHQATLKVPLLLRVRGVPVNV